MLGLSYKCLRVIYLFQDGGQYLVAVDESNDHVMSVWDWQKTDRGQRITDVKVAVVIILCSGLILVFTEKVVSV